MWLIIILAGLTQITRQSLLKLDSLSVEKEALPWDYKKSISRIRPQEIVVWLSLLMMQQSKEFPSWFLNAPSPSVPSGKSPTMFSARSGQRPVSGVSASNALGSKTRSIPRASGGHEFPSGNVPGSEYYISTFSLFVFEPLMYMGSDALMYVGFPYTICIKFGCFLLLIYLMSI